MRLNSQTFAANCPIFICTLRLILTLSVAFALEACTSPSETVSVKGLLVSVESQPVSERVWEDVSLRKLHDLPRDANMILFKPTATRTDTMNNVYVMDFGDMKVKRFDPFGKHVATYGEGPGTGPGEFNGMLDTGIMGDSVVYVLDGNARKVLLFTMAGDFLRDIAIGVLANRYVITPQGRSYLHTTARLELFETRKGSDTTVIRFGGDVLKGQSTWNNLLARGEIDTYGERLVYAPHYFPVIMQFSPNGSIAYVRSTPDFGQVEMPRLDGKPLVYRRVDSRRIHTKIIVEGEQIYVRAWPNEFLNVIDIYEAATGDYRSSIHLPTDLRYIYSFNQRIYAHNDTTVSVYAIEKKLSSP